jgi:hypothetical protein
VRKDIYYHRLAQSPHLGILLFLALQRIAKLCYAMRLKVGDLPENHRLMLKKMGKLLAE